MLRRYFKEINDTTPDNMGADHTYVVRYVDVVGAPAYIPSRVKLIKLARLLLLSSSTFFLVLLPKKQLEAPTDNSGGDGELTCCKLNTFIFYFI